jgi:gliding motility-associated lipoprotein GldH
LKRYFLLLLFLVSLLTACTQIDLFEKNLAIPGQQWKSSFKPAINFTISDTASFYNMYVVIRHSDAYRYNNIWLKVGIQPPGDTIKQQQLDLTLATDSKGWLGTGIDDIYEHRIRITSTPYQFKKKGVYMFTLEQTMREDPLLYMMNIGLRLEKVQP